MISMAIPTFDKFFRPVLEFASKQPITRTAATAEMIKLHSLNADDVAQKLASGSSTVSNRVGWAMTFLTKAGLIAKTAPKTYQATQLGHDFLVKHEGRIREADLKTIPGYEEAWAAGSAKRREKESVSPDLSENAKSATATPHEVIAKELATLEADLRGRLLQTIIDQTPAFFERLVLDVLTKMGYGGSLEDAAKHVGQSGDEGIDGRINQDALGLDQVLVQAKKYRPDRTIDRKEIQAFVGSLSGQGVTKGVFITTSSFVSSAHEFVARGLNTKVVLVDGKMLIDLMIRYGIGLRVAQEFKIHEIDQNYFDEEE
jgi:restriction system protein